MFLVVIVPLHAYESHLYQLANGKDAVLACAFLGVGSGAMINISDRLEAKLEGHAYDRKLKIQSPRKFKEFALTKDGSEVVAAMSPGVAAEIAAKEQPSRGDLKKLGVTGWNAEERKQVASLFRDALADQEQMAYNQRIIEQTQESVARKQREAEKALEHEIEGKNLPVRRRSQHRESQRPCVSRLVSDFVILITIHVCTQQ